MARTDPRRAAFATAMPHAAAARPSRANLLIVLLGGCILQYVWRIQEMFPVLAAIQFTTLVSVGAMVMFAADASARRRLGRLKHPIFIPILVIFALAVLSVPTSVHRGSSFEFLTGNLVKTVILVGVLVASIRDRRDIDRLLRIFVLGGVLYLVMAITATTPDAGRLGGGSYDPNDLGLFVVVTMPLCVYLMRRGAPWMDRILGLVATVALMIGTVLSGSRGGFLALVAVACYGVLMLDAVRWTRRLVVTVAAAVVLLAAAGDAYWDRIGTLLSPQEDYNWSGQAESGRVEIWKRGIGYMLDRPVLGVGVSVFGVAEGTLAPEAAVSRAMGAGFKWSTAHNMYIQIGAEIGILGLATFVALLWFAYRTARRIGRKALTRGDRLLGQAFAALIVGYAVGGSFLSQAYATYLYFALGLLIGLSRVVDRDARQAAWVALARGYTPPAGAINYPATTGRRRRAL